MVSAELKIIATDLRHFLMIPTIIQRVTNLVERSILRHWHNRGCWIRERAASVPVVTITSFRYSPAFYSGTTYVTLRALLQSSLACPFFSFLFSRVAHATNYLLTENEKIVIMQSQSRVNYNMATCICRKPS